MDKKKSQLEKTFTPDFLNYASKAQKIKNYILLWNIRFLWIFSILQFLGIIGLYLGFYFKNIKGLQIATSALSVLPFLFSISFIIIFHLVKKDFAKYQIESNQNATNSTSEISSETPIKEKNVFLRESRDYILLIGTSFGYFIGIAAMAALNTSKIIQHDNILNLILPIVIAIFIPIITSLFQNFTQFINEISDNFNKNIKENKGIIEYSVEIKEHKWEKLNKIWLIGDRAAKICNWFIEAFQSEDRKFVLACQAHEPSTLKIN